MTRKKAKQLLPVIQAWAEGKVVEFRTSAEDDWIEAKELSFSANPENYRIKPNPQYRPFANAQECWEEMQKHQPFGWVKNKKKNNGYSYMTFLNNSVDYKCVYKLYTFIDGTPFGKLEEEKV